MYLCIICKFLVMVLFYHYHTANKLNEDGLVSRNGLLKIKMIFYKGRQFIFHISNSIFQFAKAYSSLFG